MYIWIWKTPGGRDFGKGATWAKQGEWGASSQATWERGGRILSQQGGFQVSKAGGTRGNKGSKGNKGNEGSEGNNRVHTTYLVSCIYRMLAMIE
jgi:hypothetical protein